MPTPILVEVHNGATITSAQPRREPLPATLTFNINAAVAAPSLSSISPISTPAGGHDFTMTVNGSGFLPGSTAQWNGSALTTTYFNGTQMTASVTAALIATPGSASVTVMNPNGTTSNAVKFTIGPTASSGGSRAGGFSIITASPLPAGTVGVPLLPAPCRSRAASRFLQTLAITAGGLPPGLPRCNDAWGVLPAC